MGVSIGVVALNMLLMLVTILSAYAQTPETIKYFLELAQALNHVVINEPVTTTNLNDIRECVSKTVYNQSTGALEGSQELTDEIRSTYQQVNMKFIDMQIMAHNPWLESSISLARLLVLGLIVFGIASLALEQPSAAEIAVLTVFLVYISLFVISSILIILVLVISPLIILLLCCYCCFRGD